MRQESDIDAFLEAQGWKTAARQALPADFSTRQFARLTRADAKPERAILMMAAPEQKTAEFVAVSGILLAADIVAPKVYGCDLKHHLVVMEDFGDSNAGRLVDNGQDARAYYLRAAELLAKLHNNFSAMVAGLPTASGLPVKAVKSAVCFPEVADVVLPLMDAGYFAEQAGLFLDYYYPKVAGRAIDDEGRRRFAAAWRDVLQPLDAAPRTLMLRDFMLDNLMDLSWRGEATLGVVDIQEAGLGPAAYDLASLCDVVRRSGGDLMMEPVLKAYHALRPQTALPELRAACHVLAAQRNTRHLGNVSRLIQNPAQSQRASYLPRIEAYLKRLLQDKALAPVRAWFDDYQVLT